MSDDTDLIPVFMPSLSTILIAAEDKKGQPLDEDEVIEIRNNGACIMMASSDVANLVESRGYQDIDPENCWYDWQMLRRELGRKPNLAPGARVEFFDSKDAEYQDTVTKARDSLDQFRSLCKNCERWAPLVKAELAHAGSRCFVWLNDVRIRDEGFIGTVFEVPPALKGFSVGDEVIVASAEVMDWMVNDNGVLHGGFSLRFHRDRLPENERAAFDEHLGVREYS